MTRLVWAVAACLLAAALWPTEGSAQDRRRVAIVVGNAQYSSDSAHPANLHSPIHDSALYTDVLTELGWEVLNGEADQRDNLTKARFHGLVRDMLEYNDGVSGADVLIVFSGHGFSDDRDNHLVFVPPVGEDAYTDISEITVNSFRVGEILEMINSGRPRRLILVVDACSDRPIHAGLRASPARQSEYRTGRTDVLVLYSSNPGGIAYDVLDNTEAGGGAAVNSVFTRIFAPRLRQGGPLLRAFIDARIEVEGLTSETKKQRQRPFIIFDTIDGDFSLSPSTATVAAAANVVERNWRQDPEICRSSTDQTREALELRSDEGWSNADERKAGELCIFEAALAGLGVADVSFRQRTKIRVAAAEDGGKFANGDDIRMLQIFGADGDRKRIVRLNDLRTFEQAIARYAFQPGFTLSFLVYRTGRGDQEFVRHTY